MRGIFQGCKKGNVYFGAGYFYLSLSHYTKVDIMCYTFHSRLAENSVNLGRVIANKIVGDKPKAKVRICENLHSKVYLCWTAKKLCDVYVGSWNFSPASYLELVYSVRESDKEHILEYFNEIWRQCE